MRASGGRALRGASAHALGGAPLGPPGGCSYGRNLMENFNLEVPELVGYLEYSRER
jgi:hypothetical protein